MNAIVRVRVAALVLSLGALALPARVHAWGPANGPYTGGIRIEGIAARAVLVDQSGRMDLIRDSGPKHGIPGCVRDVGHKGRELGEDVDAGDYVQFDLTSVSTGSYSLWLSSASARQIDLTVQRFMSDSPNAKPCGSDRQLRIAGGRWYRIVLNLGAAPSGDSCRVSIGPLAARRAPLAIRSAK